MKYFILTAFLLISILSFNLNAQQISSETYQKDLIHEDFNNQGQYFKTITATDNYFILDKGDYLMSRHNNDSEYAIIANNSTVSDFVLKTAVRIGPSKNKRASIGVILKAQQDNKSAIIFEINKKRQYRIKQLVDSEYKTLSGKAKREGWVKNKIVNGVDEHNFIEIRSEENTYDVYINSEYLTTFSVPDLNSGSCGIIISPETKARVSYYHVSIKGKKSVVSNHANENTENINTTVEELNKKITALEKNNTKLHELNTETKTLQEKQIEQLNSNKENLKNITTEKEKEITSLNKKINTLKNDHTSLNKEVSSLTANLKETTSELEKENKNNAKLHKINIKHKNDLKNKNQQIQELNQRVNLKKEKITNLNKKNTNLSSVTLEQEKKIKGLQSLVKDMKLTENKVSTKNNELNKKVTGLKKQITAQNSENTKLTSKLNKSSNELSGLKKTQAKHDNVIKNLDDEITGMNTTISELNNQVETANKQNKTLQLTNDELKELFILKDFEMNGIKPSEIKKETSNTPPAPKILKGNKTIYSVQFGVYMQIQPYTSIKNIDNVWYNTTDQGTYVYYSGEFNEPHVAAAHMNNLISKGYKNSFVVTLSK